MRVLLPAVVHAAPVADVVLVKYLVRVVRASPQDGEETGVDWEDALTCPGPATPHTSGRSQNSPAPGGISIALSLYGVRVTSMNRQNLSYYNRSFP